MTEQWSFRATGGSGRTIVTKESVDVSVDTSQSISGGIEVWTRGCKDGRDIMLENKLQHCGDESIR